MEYEASIGSRLGGDMTQTEKLLDKIAIVQYERALQSLSAVWDDIENVPAEILDKCWECELAFADQILKASKEAGLMFTRTGVVGDDLEGACICKVEEIEIG